MNQQVAHEIIALELLALMLENPTDDSVEVAVGFVKECGSILQDLSPKGLHGEYAVSCRCFSHKVVFPIFLNGTFVCHCMFVLFIRLFCLHVQDLLVLDII